MNDAPAPDITPLELPAWLDFVADRSGLQVEHVALTPNADFGRAVLFLDRRGRIRQPALMPYLPVFFHPSRAKAYARTIQWHRAATILIDRMRSAGVANHLWLPPEIEDVRPWSWLGFRVDVAYGYILDLPWSPASATRSFACAIARAEEQGVRVERSTDGQAITTCLGATQGRKNFATGVTASDLNGLIAVMGDNLRAFVATSAEGDPLAAEIQLDVPGQRGQCPYGWMAGMTKAGMALGAQALCRSEAAAHTAAAGATGIELRGGNSLRLSQHTGHTGGRLVPNYGVRPYSVRTAARFGLDWGHSRTRRPRELDNSRL